jgi:hypothetical protein
MEPVPFTQEDRNAIGRLTAAVFGIEGVEESGLIHEVRAVRILLGKLQSAVIAAALSFAFGSISVAIALVATQ